MRYISQWMDVNDALRGALRGMVGAAKVYLLYVIRDDAEVTDADRDGTVGDSPTDVYSTWDDYYIRCTLHSGPHWDTDNQRVFGVLREIVHNTTNWVHIANFEVDGKGAGRKAYMSLKRQCEQEVNKDIILRKAHGVINDSRWTGRPTKSWDWNKYVAKYKEAIATFIKYKEPYSARQVCSQFVRNISDVRLDTATSMVLGPDWEPHAADFERIQLYFTNIMTSQKQKERTIAAYQRGGRGGRGRGGRGRSGRGGYQGRHGGGNHNGNGKGWRSDYLKIRGWTDDQWSQKLNNTQKDAIKAARKQLRDDSAREVSSVETEDQFGRNAHKNKKQKTDNNTHSIKKIQIFQKNIDGEERDCIKNPCK